MAIRPKFLVPNLPAGNPAVYVTNSSGQTSAGYIVNVTTPAPISTQPSIDSIQSAGNPSGTIQANQRANIYGTGLSGNITVRIGAFDPISITGTSDTFAQFLVPNLPAGNPAVYVTNSAGQTSAGYVVAVTTPTPTPTQPSITSIQSAGNPSGTIQANQMANIYGTGFGDNINVRVGASDPISVTSASDTFARFLVPNLPAGNPAVYVTNSAGQTSPGYIVTVIVSSQ